MPITLRIQKGALAGSTLQFDQPVVTIGRQQQSDLRFDAQRDLDVSALHAELRESDGRWTIVDRGSTNGTFVNGTRITAPSALHDGDIVAFGQKGPVIEVRATTGDAATGGAKRRRPTDERVAIAVKEQTRGIRIVVGIVVVLLAGVAGGLVWMNRRDSAAQLAGLEQLLAQNDSTMMKLRAQGDTAFSDALQRKSDSLRAVVQSPGRAHSDSEVDALKKQIQQLTTAAGTDFASISQHNDDAIAIIVTEIAGKRWGGTAFSVTPGGLLVTNRHCVRDSAGADASRITVQFANTTRQIPAHIVRISPTADLALLQLDAPGRFATVTGISRTGATKPGVAVVAIGFPESFDLPMAGDTVKTTLVRGTVAKRVDDLLQLDSYAAEGESGTPVFGPDGYVVGVVWGGERGSQGHIVYAVPSDKLVTFLGTDAPAIVR